MAEHQPSPAATITWPEWISKHGPAPCRAALRLWLDDLLVASTDDEHGARSIDEAGTLLADAVAAGLLTEDEGRIERQAWVRKSFELSLRKLPPAERRAHLLAGTQGASFLTLKLRVAMLREIVVW